MISNFNASNLYDLYLEHTTWNHRIEGVRFFVVAFVFFDQLWMVVASCFTCITSFQIRLEQWRTSFGVAFRSVAIPFAFSLQGCWGWRICMPIPLPLINKPVIYLLQLKTSFLNQLCFIFLLKTGKQKHQFKNCGLFWV